jgi:L-iditol 2-dehydrogenase
MIQFSRAAFVRAPFQVKIETVPVPSVGHGEVLLGVRAVGICGTDIHLASAWAREWTRFGHETVARVIRCGDGVDDLVPGDLVAVQATTACGLCAPCMNGDLRDCLDWKRSRLSHAFADHIAAPRRALWKVSSLTPLDAVLIEPLSVALDLVRVADVALGHSVAIFGPGPIGLMTLRLCKLQGASHVAVLGTDRDRHRFPLALEMGADLVVDVTRKDPVEAIKAATQGRGVDRVLVTAPVHVMNQALSTARWGGIVTFLGFETEPERAIIPIDLNDFHVRRLQLRASYAAPATFFPLAEKLLASRQVDPSKLITHTFKLEELEEGLRTVAEHADGVIKAVVLPHAESDG